MSERLRADEAVALLPFLNAQLPAWSRNKIKQRLRTGCVLVNGELVSRHDHALKVGDKVEVRTTAKSSRRDTPALEILYSDRDLVAINKPAGLLSVASAEERQHNALAILRRQLSRPKRPVKLWPVHRLDRETSGVLLFATSREMREAVTAVWSTAEKTYVAIVAGCPNPPAGRIDQPLRWDPKEHRMHVGPHPEGKSAITHFRTQRTSQGRALLEVRLETGRQHQIRAHLAWLGHPVVGDARYGTGGPGMGLHALRLSITRPLTNKRMTFETTPPDEFFALIGSGRPIHGG